MLPERFILTDRVTIIDHTEHYQYRMTYSIFGEILSIELPFLALPSNAQRLTKGQNTEKYLADLRAQQKLLRYKLPLAVLGFWKTDEFDKIKQAIADREATLGEELPDDFLRWISDDWLKTVYLKIKEDIAQKGTGDFWRGLAGLMYSDPVSLADSFRYLRAYSWQLPAAIIGDIWPTISSRPVLRHFYQHAHLYPSDSTKGWLLKALPNEGATFFRGLILQGLAVYRDETIYQVLLNHYEQQREMGEGEAEILIRALSLYATPEVQTIAWKALTGENYFAAKAAHQALKDQAISEAAIAEKLTTTFLNNKFSNRVNSLLSRFQYLEDNTLLLTAEQFLAKSAYAVKNNKNVRPQTNLASLLNRTWQSDTLRMIIELLYHPDPMVRRLGLDQISNLFVQFPKRFTHFNPDTLKRIFQLTGDANEAVSIEAIETIRILVPRLGQTSWISLLLNIQNRNERLPQILPAMLALHRKSFSALAVVPFCIKQLAHKTVNVRKNSILILQYYRLPEVESALKNLQADSDPIIREALGRGWRDNDDLIKVLS